MNNKEKVGLIIAGFITFGATTKWVYDELTGNHYDKDGYNKNGYDKYGYNKEGYNKRGFNRQGYNKEGYDKFGFDVNGIDIDGYDKKGFNENGLNRDGYDKDGYDADGYNKYGYNKLLYDKNGFDVAKQNRDYYTKEMNEIKNSLETLRDEEREHRYRMLDYRMNIEKLLRMVIEHKKGKSTLEDRNNDFLKRYIEIVDAEDLIEMNVNYLKSLKIAKNYFGDFLHPKRKDINIEKERNSIKAVEELYEKVKVALDI